jgi:hypothetical protein
MSSLSIQFYATADDLAKFVRRWMESEAVYSAAVEYHPFSVLPIGPKDADAIMRCERFQRLIFTKQPIDYLAWGNNPLLENNEGALVLDIGRTGPLGLTESCLSTMNVTATWRKIASDLKANTKAGMIGTHERNGATAKYRSMRYTRAAAKMEESGTPLRPFEQSPVRLRPDRETGRSR